MTEDNLLNGITGIVNDLSDGIASKGESRDHLLTLFTEALEPCVKTREHLQLFIYRVVCMREEQKKYFKGDYNALVIAKRMETQVDNAINKLVTELGYNLGEITKQYQQGKLL